MKKTTLAILVAGLLLLPVLSMAQVTSSGSLTVNATVESSIGMIFNNDPAGKALTAGATTNLATLDFGNISAYGTVAAGVTRNVVGANFIVSTPVDVQVNASNIVSANWSVTAQLSAVAGGNVWSLNGVALNNLTATAIPGNHAYGAPGSAYSVELTVPLASGAGPITNTINFVATAN